MQECKTTYGIGYFTDESGTHIYPKTIQSPFTEKATCPIWILISTGGYQALGKCCSIEDTRSPKLE